MGYFCLLSILGAVLCSSKTDIPSPLSLCAENLVLVCPVLTPVLSVTFLLKCSWALYEDEGGGEVSAEVVKSESLRWVRELISKDTTSLWPGGLYPSPQACLNVLKAGFLISLRVNSSGHQGGIHNAFRTVSPMSSVRVPPSLLITQSSQLALCGQDIESQEVRTSELA